MRSAVCSVFAVLLVISGCSAGPGPVGEPEVGGSAFPAGAAVDYQLGGAYPPPDGVGLVVRDSTAQPAAGIFNVCYVNGFQTQPAEREVWLRDRRDLVLFEGGGPVVDEDWPDELLLDTSTPDKRRRLAEIRGRTIESCAAAGFDAVEIDNLDSYTRSDGALTAEDNLAFAADLARIAHHAGLLIGQKNAADLTGRVGFDFAVAEECLQHDECADYAAAYGDRVIDVEYTDNLAEPPEQTCARQDRPRATVIRDRDLVPPGDEEHFYHQC
ncbi:Glycoside-hydrolase family GH114 [Saccharopolyspora kobensis]|uniref:Glycoside-hydrolase family GH114 n=1 Tax=Saccharopolyspora kobensis TaxID=146035 RepID=A0A1H5U4K9_9PSEU|nr:endo alpha-1,4 polygalactosaminidase [Saccharopolyspora kobensis]SEF69993.1 Glycoside-hydrolase family GH114 [Saccharopolyspora kobensis]SFC77337.1 Glycoside-hydrolase family GH114 [Saccharopolyspora kobensis]